MANDAGGDAPRSKKGAKKGRSRSSVQEELALNAGQSEFVRIVRVEPKREANADDPHRVALSKTGKASQLVLSEDRLTVTGSKGFRTVRCSHGIFNGAWYCEVKVAHLGSTGHVRLGWCTKKAELQAPVGFDTHGLCYRDLEGHKVTGGKREAYGAEYGEGDVIGLYIYLPEGGRSLEQRERNVVRFKGSLYYVDEQEEQPAPLKGSVVAFTKNGVLQGTAFSDIMDGTYYPAASLFTQPSQAEGATVTFNFGPDFTHPPPEVPDCPAARPVCEMAEAVPAPAPVAVPAAAVPAADGGDAAAAVPAGEEAAQA